MAFSGTLGLENSDLILRSALLRASRRMDARHGLATILRDGRPNGGLLRMRYFFLSSPSYPPDMARMISTASPSCTAVVGQAARRTTAPLSEIAKPRGSEIS